jgi:uncharacterized protein with PQ loop repeat
MTQALGWFASAVLLITISQQVYKQYKSGHSEGVSWLLFIGQCVASATFVVYSYLIGSWVFVITNAMMLLSAIVGLAITFHQKTDDD